jgi:hypothetical protein
MTASDSLDPQSQTDGIDPQSETLKLAESLSNSSTLLQQNAQIVSHDQLSTLTQIHDQQRTVMHHYMIKLVSDLRQVRGFLRILRFLPPIKLTATI